MARRDPVPVPRLCPAPAKPRLRPSPSRGTSPSPTAFSHASCSSAIHPPRASAIGTGHGQAFLRPIELLIPIQPAASVAAKAKQKLTPPPSSVFDPQEKTESQAAASEKKPWSISRAAGRGIHRAATAAALTSSRQILLRQPLVTWLWTFLNPFTNRMTPPSSWEKTWTPAVLKPRWVCTFWSSFIFCFCLYGGSPLQK